MGIKMFASAEKTKNINVQRQQQQPQQSFFHQAGEGSFFGAKDTPSFFAQPVQTKLNISSPDDPQEREADAVADQVMRMPDPSPAIAQKEEEKIQKKEDDRDEEVQAKYQTPEIKLQRKDIQSVNQVKVYSTQFNNINRKGSDEIDDELSVQRKFNSSEIFISRSERGPPSASVNTSFQQGLSSSKGNGSPMSENTQHFMESRFGADFSNVRIHTGSYAENLSSSINAQAFTHGNDVYFNSGKYSPQTEAGGTLLAHELTHTIQQKAVKNIHRTKAGTSGIIHRKATTRPPPMQLDSAVQHAKGEIGKVNASETGPDGFRVGWQRLLEYFKTSMGDNKIIPEGSPYITGGISESNIKTYKKITGTPPAKPERPPGETPYTRDIMPSWCGIFVFWALNKGGVPMRKWGLGGKNVPLKAAYPPGHIPQAGDIAYRDNYSHFAIVENTNGQSVTTINGNTAGEDNLGAQIQSKDHSIKSWTAFFDPLLIMDGNLKEPAKLEGGAVNNTSTNTVSSGGTTSKPVAANSAVPVPSQKGIPVSVPSKGKEKQVNDEGASKEAVASIPKAPTHPNEDPAFKAVTSNTKKASKGLKQHNDAGEKSKAGLDAAEIDEGKEKESKARDAQLAKMGLQPKGKFDANAFAEKLIAKATEAIPDNEEDAKKFKDENKLGTIKGDLNADVKSEKDAAGNAIEETTAQTPDPSTQTHDKGLPLPNEELGKKPFVPDPKNAAPKPKTDEEISMEADAVEIDEQMADAKVTDEQLANSNEPEFTGALETKTNAQKEARSAPGEYRAIEDPALQKAEKQAEGNVWGKMGEVFDERKGLLGGVDGKKKDTKSKNETKKMEIANSLNSIYNDTKLKVEETLTNLETTVTNDFDTAATGANADFEANVDRRLDDYYGWFTIDDEISEYFNGLPKEIHDIFEDEKEKFIKKLDTAIRSIAQKVETELTKAMDLIAEGTKKKEEYWKSLSDEEQKLGQEAYDDINGKFTALEDTVASKQEDLLQNLSQRYVQNVKGLKEKFDKIKASKKSFLSAAIDAVAGVIKTILRLKDMLFEVLAKVAAVIGAIISDPINFLGNLVSAIGQGLNNFVTNILTHLQKGFIEWLMGNMPPGIQLPDTWDLKGIFSFVMQILGLTWANIRQRAVLKLGEPLVAALETGFEIFQIIVNEGITGLWRFIVEKVGDLKTMVMDAIKNMLIEQVIKAGIKWLIGLLNPAGAFIKACMLIYDIIMFFVNNGERILSFVNTVIDSVALIVKGSLGAAAKMVENALARIIPIAIGFLASLLGLGSLTEKVQAIIKKIQEPIIRAIDWVIDKAIAFSKKLGLDKAVKSVKGGVNKGKDWAKDKVKEGRDMAIVAVKKILYWLGLRKDFRTPDGENHSLYLSGTEENPVLMVASDPEAIKSFLNSFLKQKDLKEDKKNRAKDALSYVEETIDPVLEKLKTQKVESEQTSLRQKLLAFFNVLAEKISKLLGAAPLNEIMENEKYSLEGLTGTYGTMPKPKADKFTADHQPQAAIFKYLAGLSFFKGTKMEHKAAGKHADAAHAINLQHRRHVGGRTYGSNGRSTINTFKDSVEGINKEAISENKKREKVISIIGTELKDDVEMIKGKAQKDDYFPDIDELGMRGDQKKKMINSIRKQIIAGEDIIASQNLNELAEKK